MSSARFSVNSLDNCGWAEEIVLTLQVKPSLGSTLAVVSSEKNWKGASLQIEFSQIMASVSTSNGTQINRPVSRRDFLTLASSALALNLTGFSQSDGAGVSKPGETNSLEFSGISAEHYEAARGRAAELVSTMTLAEKITQFGSTAPAVTRIALPAFSYYASEALHGLVHNGPVTSFPLPLALGCSWNRSLVLQVFTAASDEVWAWHKKDGMDLGTC